MRARTKAGAKSGRRTRPAPGGAVGVRLKPLFSLNAVILLSFCASPSLLLPVCSMCVPTKGPRAHILFSLPLAPCLFSLSHARGGIDVEGGLAQRRKSRRGREEGRGKTKAAPQKRRGGKERGRVCEREVISTIRRRCGGCLRDLSFLLDDLGECSALPAWDGGCEGGGAATCCPSCLRRFISSGFRASGSSDDTFSAAMHQHQLSVEVCVASLILSSSLFLSLFFSLSAWLWLETQSCRNTHKNAFSNATPSHPGREREGRTERKREDTHSGRERLPSSFSSFPQCRVNEEVSQNRL
jgi:hypothetical protein